MKQNTNITELLNFKIEKKEGLRKGEIIQRFSSFVEMFVLVACRSVYIQRYCMLVICRLMPLTCDNDVSWDAFTEQTTLHRRRNDHYTPCVT